MQESVQFPAMNTDPARRCRESGVAGCACRGRCSECSNAGIRRAHAGRGTPIQASGCSREWRKFCKVLGAPIDHDRARIVENQDLPACACRGRRSEARMPARDRITAPTFVARASEAHVLRKLTAELSRRDRRTRPVGPCARRQRLSAYRLTRAGHGPHIPYLFGRPLRDPSSVRIRKSGQAACRFGAPRREERRPSISCSRWPYLHQGPRSIRARTVRLPVLLRARGSLQPGEREGALRSHNKNKHSPRR